MTVGNSLNELSKYTRIIVYADGEEYEVKFGNLIRDKVYKLKCSLKRFLDYKVIGIYPEGNTVRVPIENGGEYNE